MDLAKVNLARITLSPVRVGQLVDKEGNGCITSTPNWITHLIWDNATMSSRNQRVSNGINSLVRRLLVDIPGEDADSANEREQNAIEFVTEFLGR